MDFKERPGVQALERTIWDAVIVKPEVPWKPQEFRNIKNVGCVLRKTADSKWRLPKRETMRAITGKLMKPFELASHYNFLVCVASGFKVCPVSFQPCFGSLPLCHPIPLFWNENAYPALVYVRHI